MDENVNEACDFDMGDPTINGKYIGPQQEYQFKGVSKMPNETFELNFSVLK